VQITAIGASFDPEHGISPCDSLVRDDRARLLRRQPPRWTIVTLYRQGRLP